MVQGTRIADDVVALLDEGIEALRWCRAHLDEPRAPERLHALELSLSALALALDYDRDGDQRSALSALEHADGLRRVPSHPLFLGNPDPPECG